jgi:choline kinase
MDLPHVRTTSPQSAAPTPASSTSAPTLASSKLASPKHAAATPADPIEVIAYFGDDPVRAYQLRQWLPVLEQLDVAHRVLVVLRDPATAAAVGPQTWLPQALVPSFGELTELYRHVEAKVVLYVNNSARNFQSLVARSMIHVHVNHGESDKICMVSNQVKAYDRVFVAGEAAVARHRSALIGFDVARLVPVGRPQLDLRPQPALPPSPRRTVLYAPTWEGEEPSNNYSSVDGMGSRIVAEALRLPDVRVVYKPHPRVVSSRTPRMVAAHREILDTLAAASAVDPDAGHAYLPDADILAVFAGCDLMITDVSSVGLDFLYLHADKPLLIADRYADPERLREAAPVSRCADVVVPASLDGLADLISARLADDAHAAARARMRRHYFGDKAVGASTACFLTRIGEAIATRDRQVRLRATAPGAAAAAALGAPGSFGDPMLDDTHAHTKAYAGAAGELAGAARSARPASVQAVILAAGLGSRLGMPFPKPLTPLSDGRSILVQQLDNLADAFGDAVRATVVVGFRPDLLMAAVAPGHDVSFVLNERYDRTNTSKSLLKALRASGPGGVLWLNGDVVFDAGLLDLVAPLIAREQTFVCVNRATVGDEEVSYRVDGYGFVTVLSKGVTDGLGEAVGINYIASHDKATLIEHLEGCADQDYFERGIETAVAAGLKVRPVDISAYFAVEVDFTADLERANQEVSKTVTSAA